MPTEAKYGVYKYFAKEILIKSNNLSITEVNKSEVKSSLIWIKNNLPQLDYKNYENINSPYEIGVAIINEKDRIKFYKYLNQRAYEIIFDNVFLTLKNVFNGFIHFSVINSFFVYYDYEFYKNYSSTTIGDFSFSEKHKQLIPIRIIYTLFIYIVCLIGLVQIFKKQPKITLLILLSILYYYVILGWYGKTRLYTPCLIYLSVFFGYGMNFILNKFKIYKGTF